MFGSGFSLLKNKKKNENRKNIFGFIFFFLKIYRT